MDIRCSGRFDCCRGVHSGFAAAARFRVPRPGNYVRDFLRPLAYLRQRIFGIRADSGAQPGAVGSRTTQRANGLAVQGKDGSRRDGHFSAASGFYVYLQLRAGNLERSMPGFRGLWRLRNEQSQVLLADLEKSEYQRLSDIAAQAASHAVPDQIFMDLSHAVDAFWIVDSHGKVAAGVDFAKGSNANNRANSTGSIVPTLAQTIASGAQVWKKPADSFISRGMLR